MANAGEEGQDSGGRELGKHDGPRATRVSTVRTTGSPVAKGLFAGRPRV